MLHFYRGVIVRGLPPENEAVFELTFSLKSGGCNLEAVQMIEPFSEKLVSASLLSAHKELIKSFNKSKFVKSVMSGVREEYAQTCPQLKLKISTDSNFVAEGTCSSDYEEAVFVSFRGHFLKTVPYVEKVELRHFN